LSPRTFRAYSKHKKERVYLPSFRVRVQVNTMAKHIFGFEEEEEDCDCDDCDCEDTEDEEF
jgi:hypothetical protein